MFVFELAVGLAAVGLSAEAYAVVAEFLLHDQRGGVAGEVAVFEAAEFEVLKGAADFFSEGFGAVAFSVIAGGNPDAAAGGAVEVADAVEGDAADELALGFEFDGEVAGVGLVGLGGVEEESGAGFLLGKCPRCLA